MVKERFMEEVPLPEFELGRRSWSGPCFRRPAVASRLEEGQVAGGYKTRSCGDAQGWCHSAITQVSEPPSLELAPSHRVSAGQRNSDPCPQGEPDWMAISHASDWREGEDEPRVGPARFEGPSGILVPPGPPPLSSREQPGPLPHCSIRSPPEAGLLRGPQT